MEKTDEDRKSSGQAQVWMKMCLIPLVDVLMN